MTRYRIEDIRPNPFRNVERYPINREKVEKLKESIGRTEFWDNLVARLGLDGKPEIGYGHHRMVALRELYAPDHEINLIIRDLDDAAMLHVMADENMQEWSSTGAVIVETVRAVQGYLNTLRPAVKNAAPGQPPKLNGVEEITAFLGWPRGRVAEALSIIAAEEQGVLQPEDTADLGIEQATIMRRHVARIPDPIIRSRAIAQVRDDLKEGRIGKRGIGEVVRAVREEAQPTAKATIPYDVALGLVRDIERFFRTAVIVGGRPVSRYDLILEIARHRDVVELRGVAGPMADQVSSALRDMATEARTLADSLTSQEGASREAAIELPVAVTA